MPLQKLPSSLPLDKLYLDVQLTADSVISNKTLDYTGRPTFRTGMWRDQNIGFGITAIHIETGASLQPIVEITFKDLYGHTVFGRFNNNSKIYESDIDYGVIFDWPSPKFKFTFKGYLGKPVTWIMNLKRTTTTLNPEDGSYEIKATFVPNHWGFFADIPYLYLLGVKKLKQNLGVGTKNINDLVNIGKTVQQKTKVVTKEYDSIQKQIAVLKSNAIDGLISQTFKRDETITGKVAGRAAIADFKPLTIKLHAGWPVDQNKFDEQLKSVRGDARKSSVEHRKIVALIGNPNLTVDPIIGATGRTSTAEFTTAISLGQKILSDNLEQIDKEIKRRFYEANSEQLGKITISEIFSRLAGDGAFILGSILGAGEIGYNGFAGARKASKGLIGLHYPLTMDPETNVQVPPRKDTSLGIESEGAEMHFVRNFIEAISEGIASSRQDDDGPDLSGENKLKNRISNLEVLADNPYANAVTSIEFEKNILQRTGIIAHLTRSFDPNQPGDYNTNIGLDNDSEDDIKRLVDKELQNIDEKYIAKLEQTEVEQLKKFCTFLNNFISEDGEDIIDAYGAEHKGINGVSLPEILNYYVPLIRPNVDGITQEALKGTAANIIQYEARTVGQFFARYLAPNGLFHGTFVDPIFNTTETTVPAGFYNTFSWDTFTATKTIHNNTIFTYPPDLGDDIYTYVIFSRDQDLIGLDGVTNADSDSEFADDKFKDTSKPLGIVKISKLRDKDNKLLERVEVLNSAIKAGEVLNYDKIKDINNFNGDTAALLWTDEISESNFNGTLAYAVYAHSEDLGAFEFQGRLSWGPFVSSGKGGLSQRFAMKHIAQELLLKITKIEDEKNQILSQVLGKASSHEDNLYQQFHHIYHQWQTLIRTTDGNNVPLVDDMKQLPVKLEEIYSSNASDSKASFGFKYDYPLERITKPSELTNVAHSVIDIQPLYKPNANTTMLNIIQQICTKNNFLFIPIPGNGAYTNINEIFKPQDAGNPIVGNYFHVMFTPTPESRTKDNQNNHLQIFPDGKPPADMDAFVIEYGSPRNTIIKSIAASTEDNRPTAESILNLQSLVDKDNSHKAPTTNCSMLSVMEGRSYTMQVNCIGNGQISPMQFFVVTNTPIFGGLYQIMKTSHNISPNDMTTTFEGIKMRFNINSKGGIKPITLEDLEELGSASKLEMPNVIPNPVATGSVAPPVPTDDLGINTVEYGRRDPFVGTIFNVPYKLIATSGGGQKILIDNPFYISDDGKKQNIANTPDNDQVNKNIIALQEKLLVPLHDQFGASIVINSGYRNNKINASVGGVQGSNHTKGLACDVRIPSLPNNGVVEMYNWLIENWRTKNLPIKELICENKGVFWLHIAITDSHKFEDRNPIFKIYDSKAGNPYVVQNTAKVKQIKSPYGGRFPGTYTDGTTFG